MRRALAVIGVVLIGAIALLWIGRRTVADTAIADALAKAGVPARYRVAEIGLRWQRIEQVSLGDPATPDLTADWVEVRIDTDWNGVRTTAIRAGNLRLRGRVDGDRVSWGVLDRLLPQSRALPFALPAIAVDVRDVRVGLDTPFGQLGARIDGRGRLDDGFSGKVALIAPVLAVPGCAAVRATAYVDVASRRSALLLKGPVRIGDARCGGVALAASALAVDAALAPGFKSWRGTAQLALGQLRGGGGDASAINGKITFLGNLNANTGSAELALRGGRYGSVRFVGGTIDGSFAQRGGDFDTKGRIHFDSVFPDPESLRPVRSLAAAVRTTPIGPLASQLETALDGAAAGASLDADLAAIVRADGASATITRLTAQTRSGAALTLSDGTGVRFGALGLVAEAQIVMSGGGFPAIQGRFRRFATGETRGIMQVAPITGGGARLALMPIRFRARADGGVRVSTIATLDGPFGGGRVVGLAAPLVIGTDARGTVSVNPGCTPIVFSALDYATLRLAGTRLALCPIGQALLRRENGRVSGGAAIAGLRLTGMLGKTPLTMAARTVRVDLAARNFTLADGSVRLGPPDRVTRIDLARLDGRLSGDAVAGQFTRLGGQIGKVPLIVTEAAGPWRFARGTLAVTGIAEIEDAASPERFRKLNVKTVRLTLANGRISMTGVLNERGSGTALAALDLRHDLADGIGRVTLDVAGLDFGTRLQPEAITPLTIAVIANVSGRIAGRGDIAWDAQGVTSSGRFGMRNLDFAAAFGPVAGVTGDIVFTDLIGLVTAPGQTATIASVNPGIDVRDGRLRYRLAAGQRIVVEDGRWPFAGGMLRLEPAVLDMGQSQQRQLTFRVDALDAAKFIEMLQFEDLAATGTFDGTIPMIFDAQGGRIEGGRITARAGGGTIAYVGDVSNAKLNVYAKLAFDALKSLKYQNLGVGLQGPLDGEMVSTVDFRGVNQAPVVQPKNFIVRKFIGLPFKFNIVIRAPFRSLLYTVRTFQDPSLLIRAIPVQPTVQPPASEQRP